MCICSLVWLCLRVRAHTNTHTHVHMHTHSSVTNGVFYAPFSLSSNVSFFIPPACHQIYPSGYSGNVVNGKHRKMVNGLHLYSAFIQSAVQFMPLIHPSHTHIHTPTAIGCHARYQPARQEQSGVRRLAQGHFDTPRVGSNRQPPDCQTTALTTWAISPTSPTTCTLKIWRFWQCSICLYYVVYMNWF